MAQRQNEYGGTFTSAIRFVFENQVPSLSSPFTLLEGEFQLDGPEVSKSNGHEPADLSVFEVACRLGRSVMI